MLQMAGSSFRCSFCNGCRCFLKKDHKKKDIRMLIEVYLNVCMDTKLLLTQKCKLPTMTSNRADSYFCRYWLEVGIKVASTSWKSLLCRQRSDVNCSGIYVEIHGKNETFRAIKLFGPVVEICRGDCEIDMARNFATAVFCQIQNGFPSGLMTEAMSMKFSNVCVQIRLPHLFCTHWQIIAVWMVS